MCARTIWWGDLVTGARFRLGSDCMGGACWMWDLGRDEVRANSGEWDR